MLGISADTLGRGLDRLKSGMLTFFFGALRGFVTAFAAIVAVSLITIVVLATQNTSSAIPNGFLLGITSVAMAVGASVDLVPEAANLAFSQPISGDIAVRLTGISIAIFFALFAIARRWMRKRKSADRSRVWVFAGGVSIAFTITIAVSLTLVAGNYGGFGISGYIGPLSWPSTVTVLLFALLPAIFAVLLDLFPSQLIQWTRLFWTALFTYYVVLMVLVGLVFVAYNAISPHYGVAAPSSNPAVPTGTLLASVFGVLLVLPTLVYSAVLLAMGGAAGIHVAVPSGALSPIDTALTSFGSVRIPVSVSILESFGWSAYVVSVVVLVIGALLASSAASWRAGLIPKSFNQVITTVLISGLASVVLALFMASTVNWTLTSQQDSGTTTQIVGSIRAGVSVFGTAALATIVALGAVYIARYSAQFVSESVPRAIALLSWRRSGPVEQGIASRIVGYSATAIMLLLIVLPVFKASVDRAWASFDSPEKLGSSLADQLQSGDLAQAKALLGGTELTRWLDDKILTDARATSSDSRTIQVVNSLGEPWQLGNLDATISVAWKNSDGTTNWVVPTESKLISVAGILSHATYKPVIETPQIQFVPGEFMPESAMTTLEVNSIPVVAGEYAAIPGSYKVTAKGYQLIAPTELVVSLDGSLTNVDIGSAIQLPSGSDEKLVVARDAQLATCKTIDVASGGSACVSADAVSKSAQPKVGDVPQNFFGQTDRDFKQESVSCSANPTKKLLSASQVLAEFSCSEIVTFTRDYTARSIRVTQVPIYKDVEVTRYVCSDTPGLVSCVPQKTSVRRIVGYENQQTETEGKVFKTLDMTSESSFVIQTVGSLDSNGSFVAR